MAKGDRIIKVTGYLVLSKKDSAATESLATILEDGKMGLWGLGELDDLVLADEPKARVTKQGIRVDQSRRGEAMPTGREKPGEHWNARIIREEREDRQ